MPAGTLKEMPATAVAAGYTLMRSRTSRMGVLTMGWGVGWLRDRRAILNYPGKSRLMSVRGDRIDRTASQPNRHGRLP